MDWAREAYTLLNQHTVEQVEQYNTQSYQVIRKEVLKARREVVELHNKYLTKKGHYIGPDHYTHPFVVDKETLVRKSKQPKFVRQNAWTVWPRTPRKNILNDVKFKHVCNGQHVGVHVSREKPFLQCGYIHHHDPYLRLGPFKAEVLLHDPLRVIFHDILTDAEINFLIDYSKPKLSNARDISKYNSQVSDAELRNGKKGRTVSKTNQVWMSEAEYTFPDNYTVVSSVPPVFVMDDIPGDYKEHTVKFPVLAALTTKIELATNFVVKERFAASDYQVTNYG